MRINHNMSAIFANRQIKAVSLALDKSIEKLASGETINRAGDDASGLAVSEKMRTQINGLIQAERNAQNGLSFIQVAEGSLQQINDILQRINPTIKAAEFHFKNVEKTDAPAMAIIVSVVKYLLTKKIVSKAMGLSGECMELATILGLHTMAQVEA